MESTGTDYKDPIGEMYEEPDFSDDQNSNQIMQVLENIKEEPDLLSSMQSPPHTSESHKLYELLTDWNLESLYDHLLAEKIFVDVLKIMKFRHIERLLSNLDMGTQIMFEHKLELWRQSIGRPLIYDSVQNYTSNFSNPPLSSHREVSFNSSSTSKHTPYSRPTTPDEGNKIHLSNILNETQKGIMLSEYYKKFGKFQEDQRTSLISTIAQYFEEKAIAMSLSLSYRLEKEILQQFPSEKLEFYRTSKRGKLYNKYSNMKKSFNSAISNHLLPKSDKDPPKLSKTLSDKIFVPEIDAESSVRALKFDNLTSEQFDNCWKACGQYRMEQLKKMQNTAEIFTKWPFYKNPSGYRLVDMDFQLVFGKSHSLLSNWEQSYKKIVTFLMGENNIKDKIVRNLLRAVSEGNISENGRDASIFQSIHAYLVPTNRIIQKDANTGRKNITKFSIKDSQESFLFIGKTAQEIEDHLKNRQKSVQPIITGIGEDIRTINEISVCFDDVKFKFHTFLRAVDICFKIIYIFSLDFPRESIMFWTFIESHFYKLKSTRSFSKVHIMSEAISD